MEIREYKRMNLKGGTVIDGFPSAGLVGTISSSCLVSSLRLDQIAAMESDSFPPLAMVYNNKPKFPARIYADEKAKLAVFISEFSPDPMLHRPIARTILRWAQEQGCAQIITSMGLPTQGEIEIDEERRVVGVGSTDSARTKLAQASIEQMHRGAVLGIAAVLLNEGRWANFDVIALVAHVHASIPDYRSGIKVAEAIDRLVPGAKCDINQLRAQAESVERQIKTVRSQAHRTIPAEQMYR